MARLRQSKKIKRGEKALFSLELQVLCTTINAVAYKELIRDWLATHSLSMNNGTLLRKGGKSTHAVLFHEAIFYQPRKKTHHSSCLLKDFLRLLFFGYMRN